MAKVTSKLQVTVPKRLAEAYGIRPGDNIEWAAAGNHLRIDPARQPVPARTPEERLKRFDQASDRQRRRQQGDFATKRSAGRGWTRQDLYARGRAR